MYILPPLSYIMTILFSFIMVLLYKTTKGQELASLKQNMLNNVEPVQQSIRLVKGLYQVFI